MYPQAVIPTPGLLLPAVVLRSLLLTETSSVMRLADTGDVMPKMLKLPATQITVVLREIPEQRGYSHSGINE
jgi:hypothetical protein